MEKNFVGNSFEGLTPQQMSQLQGSGDIQPETTPTIFIGAAAGVAISKLFC